MTAAKIIWDEKGEGGRNVFCLFLRRFEVTKPPGTLMFHLFADSLYRLRVNGEIVGYGPARFVPAHPGYDSYDIAPWLRTGQNTILVEVNSRGAPCFQAVESRGGFVAWGEDGVDLSTPGGWVVARAGAWVAEAEPFSFAQGPIEILDLDRLPEGYPAFLAGSLGGEWKFPVVLSAAEHWGKLTPRSIAMPSLEVVEPESIVIAAPIRDGHQRFGFNAENNDAAAHQPFFTHIYSPVEQEIDLGLFWGSVFVNGKELDHSKCPERGNHLTARIQLRSGWNFVYGSPAMLKPCWTWLMEIPMGRGLLLRAEPSADCNFCFGVGQIGEAPAEAPASLRDLADYPTGWRMIPCDLKSCSPARELAWDMPETPWMADVPYRGEIRLPVDAKAGTLVLDMGAEYLGHVAVEFESENGAILDIGYDERLDHDGTLGYYRFNPYVNSADRFLCGPGPQRLSTYHERGGRYIQLTFRGSPGVVTVHRVSVCLTTASHRIIGDFRCDDPVLDWTWQTGLATLRAGTGDGWLDCPWRERGMYVGDALIEAPATRKLTGDWRMEPWAIRLWAHAQFPDGQLPAVVPSSYETPLCDYTLLWIVLLRNYWAATGNGDFVREVWPAVGRIFSSPVWKTGDEGLWITHDKCRIYGDSKLVPGEQSGANGILNAFRIRALECASELAVAIGAEGEARHYTKESEEVRRAFCKALWDENSGRFASSAAGGRRAEGPALHANALVLAYALGDERQEAGALAYLEREMKSNTRCEPGYIDLYFLKFLLDGLYRVGEAGLAEQVIRVHYGLMKARGAWTFWESLAQGLSGQGSLCHPWACYPTVVFCERILGVRELVPGDPSQILVAPESETLDWAEGEVPHPNGLIGVSWRIEEDKLLLRLDLPAGVEAQIQPAGRLGALDLVMQPTQPVDSRAAALAASLIA